MDFKFSNLLGAPYRGGTLLVAGGELLTPVGARVTQVNLTESTSVTLPFEASAPLRVLAASPDGRLLLAVDVDGRALLANRPRRVLLHRIAFKGVVRAAAWSPDGAFVAVAVGRLVQVWRSPGGAKVPAPMALHRAYGHCHADVTCLAWSPCGGWIAAAGKDLAARVFSLHPLPRGGGAAARYAPPTLAGHKEAPVALAWAPPELRRAAALLGKPAPHLYTVSRDGALFAWRYDKEEGEAPGGGAAGGSGMQEDGEEEEDDDEDDDEESASSEEDDAGEASDEAGEGAPRRKRARRAGGATAAGAPPRQQQQQQQSAEFAGGRWSLVDKYFFNARGGARVTSAAFHPGAGLLAAGFSSGVLELLQLPDLATLHALSIGRDAVTSLAFSPAGDWVAAGAAALGQLLVWEWRSETFVLKQQGHAHDAAAAAFSPDGAHLATGADDAKVKVWSLASGFCYVTFADHAAPVTAVAFLPSGAGVVSASLDGTVRAHDLVRYRCFRTLTAPEPAQFSCLAVDAGGEVVAAGARDTFRVYVWALKTGRLLDVLSGHEAPVSALAFAPAGAPAGAPALASASWDRTARAWDVFGGGAGRGAAEALQHGADVLALAWRPDGRQLASAALDGQIYLWDAAEGELQAAIAARRDAGGGRGRADRRPAAAAAAGRAFTSLAYSADGAFILAGGASRYVCLYDAAERVLLRRFAVSANTALDGVLDQLDSRRVTDAGPADLIDDSDSDSDGGAGGVLRPGGAAGARAGLPGAGGGRRAPPAARARAVALAPTGRAWAAATPEGVLLYSLDEGMTFDPEGLGEGLTPAAVLRALRAGAVARALLGARALGDAALTAHCLLAAPPGAVALAAAALPGAAAAPLLAALAELLPASPHVEHLVAWAAALLARHGAALAAAGGGGGAAAPALRALHRALGQLHGDLAATAEENLYTLRYLVEAGNAADERAAAGAGAAAAAGGA